MKNWIPNSFSLGNGVCGFLAIYHIFHTGKVEWACYLILLAAVLDVFDGLLARALKVASPLGKELDSMADAVSFGVAPAAMCWFILDNAVSGELGGFLFFPAFILAMSLYRLAKFNIDTRQTFGFIGMPTPANALFWIGTVMIYTSNQLPDWMSSWTHNSIIVSALALGLSLLLNANMPLLSIKFHRFIWKGNQWKILLLVFAFAMLIIGVVFFKNLFVMLPFVLLLYLGFSVIHYLTSKNEI